MSNHDSNIYGRDLTERLISNDLSWLEMARKQGTEDEANAAWNLYAHLGRFKRSAPWEEAPSESVTEAKSTTTASRALDYLDAELYRDQVSQFLEKAHDSDPDDLTEEAEEILLLRDEIEMALDAIERFCRASEVMDRICISRAVLWQADALMKCDIHEFFTAIPLIRGHSSLFDIGTLDRISCWWWFRIVEKYEESFDSGIDELAILQSRCVGRTRLV